MTFAEKVIDFNQKLEYNGKALPVGIDIMNPFRGIENANVISSQFYRKYYNDSNSRNLILGINPGRFGAGLTGIPFTDPKCLKSECNIEYTGKITHEPSSVFVYDVIREFGGPEAFYNKFYINSVCPLGFTLKKDNGKIINYNYFQNKELQAAVYNFIVESIEKQLDFGVNRDICFCFGNSENGVFLTKLNNERKYFKEIIALEHPRFIMQYKMKTKQLYIEKYLSAFKQSL